MWTRQVMKENQKTEDVIIVLMILYRKKVHRIADICLQYCNCSVYLPGFGAGLGGKGGLESVSTVVAITNNHNSTVIIIIIPVKRTHAVIMQLPHPY